VDLILLIGGAEERAAIQLEMSTWLRISGDEKMFKEHLLRREVTKEVLVTM
jgi:hypothetical protein